MSNDALSHKPVGQFFLRNADANRLLAEQFFLSLYTPENQKAIRAGIRSVLKKAMDLCGNDAYTAEQAEHDLSQEVWVWVANHLAELSTGEPAYPKRLCGRAKCIARAWKTSTLRELKRSADGIDLERCGVVGRPFENPVLFVEPLNREMETHIG